MSSVNKVILIGNLGADPEVRYTQGGEPVCELRLATSEQWTDKQGAKQERTEWHTVSVWGKTAELCGQYLAKGRSVYVEGSLRTREYVDKEGVTRKVWEVKAEKVTFLGGGGERTVADRGQAQGPKPGGSGWRGGRGLRFGGETGRGKTHRVIATVRGLLERGVSARYVSWAVWLSDMRQAMGREADMHTLSARITDPVVVAGKDWRAR